jgi:heptose-I-phosphate ethanolaminephosphotransferase
MGSHSSYAKRYPANFSLYNNSTHKEAKTVNAYDNSILYNDFIVDSLLNQLLNYALKDTNTLYTGIYLSDHGENVYDENNNAGHDYSGSLPKSNVEIPFIVWLSPQYINKYPSKSNTILNHKHKPFISDGLFHAVLDLNHIQSPYFDSSKSVFHLNYNAKRKRILEDKMDYDLKIKNK